MEHGSSTRSQHQQIELTIATIMGTSFKLRMSSDETILDVKRRIYYREGSRGTVFSRCPSACVCVGPTSTSSVMSFHHHHHHDHVDGEGRRVVAPPCPRSTARFQSSPIVRVESFRCTVVTSAGWQATPCDPMWRVAVWQLCELLYISYLLTYLHTAAFLQSREMIRGHCEIGSIIT